MALPATGLTLIVCKIKQPQCTSVNLEINIKAAEIPVGNRSHEAMTHKDPRKFAMSWHCFQKTFSEVSCGKGYEFPATNRTTLITKFSLSEAVC